MTAMLLIGGVLIGVQGASASPLPPSTSSCTYKNNRTGASSTSKVVVANAPADTVTITCKNLLSGNYGTNPKPVAGDTVIITEGSQLAGIIDPSGQSGCEVDQSHAAFSTISATGTFTSTVTVQALSSTSTPAFTPGGSLGCTLPGNTDSNAVCPETQAQANVGVETCIFAVADVQASFTGGPAIPLNFANIAFTTQPKPAAPTMVLTPSSGTTPAAVTAKDKAGACPTLVAANTAVTTQHCWWGGAAPGGNPAFTVSWKSATGVVTNGISNTLAASKSVYCQTGATTAACTSVPAGDIVTPQLSGGFTIPSSAAGTGTATAVQPNGSGSAGKPSGKGTFKVL